MLGRHFNIKIENDKEPVCKQKAESKQENGKGSDCKQNVDSNQNKHNEEEEKEEKRLNLLLSMKDGMYESIAEEMEIERNPKDDIQSLKNKEAVKNEKNYKPFSTTQKHLMIKHVLDTDLDINEYLFVLC